VAKKPGILAILTDLPSRVGGVRAHCVQEAFLREIASKETERQELSNVEGRRFSVKTRLSRIFAGAILAMVGLVVPSGTRAASKASPDVSTASQTINKQVHHELAMLPWYGVFDNLQYQVNGTEVILSGQLISEHSQTKNDAGKEVERIPGVTNVVNNIEVLPPSSFDDQIRRAEYRAIFSKSDLGRYTLGAIPQLHIVVKNGHVFLDGVVMNQFDKTVAGIAANGVSGVFSVTNNLQVN
jgi:hyperosmotically inducible periplasmic protein